MVMDWESLNTNKMSMIFNVILRYDVNMSDFSCIFF